MGDLIEHVALKNRVRYSGTGMRLVRLLLKELTRYKAADAIVLAIPSGGVPVASEISRITGLPMDLVIVRKLQIPGNPEAGFGALSPDGETVLNENLVNELRLTPDQIREQTEKTLRVIEQRNRQIQRGQALSRAEGQVRDHRG